MKRITFGSTSCVFFACAMVGITSIGYCRWMIATTPRGGSGEFQGMNHLGYNIVIFLMIGVVPFLSLVGFVLGAIGSNPKRGDRRLGVVGCTLNGLVILVSFLVFLLRIPIL